MAIEKEKTLDDFHEESEQVEALFRQRSYDHDNEDFSKAQPLLFSWAVVISVLLIVAVYFFSDASKVKTLSVSGNNYLSSEYVENLSGIGYRSRIFLIFPDITERKIKSDPMIQDAEVHILKDNAVQITVTEKQPIGYRYQTDTATILLADGTETQLTSGLMDVIARVPYINGFYEEQQTHLLSTGLAAIKPAMIEEIAQIDQYSFDYDNEAVEIRMRDGVVIFASYYSLNVLNDYQSITSKMNNSANCLFSEQGMKYVYEKACPWNESETVLDYWKDENGNNITNQWGDPIVKHYYQDSNGGYYLDATGNWILIPIDSNGNDIVDGDFLAHFEAGYYATGTLIIPSADDATPTPTG